MAYKLHSILLIILYCYQKDISAIRNKNVILPLFKLVLIFEDLINMPTFKSNNKGFKSRWVTKPKAFFFLNFLSAKFNETLMWPKYEYVSFLPKISTVQVI